MDAGLSFQLSRCRRERGIGCRRTWGLHLIAISRDRSNCIFFNGDLIRPSWPCPSNHLAFRYKYGMLFSLWMDHRVAFYLNHRNRPHLCVFLPWGFSGILGSAHGNRSAHLSRGCPWSEVLFRIWGRGSLAACVRCRTGLDKSLPIRTHPIHNLGVGL